jgi:hypothetical protein
VDSFVGAAAILRSWRCIRLNASFEGFEEQWQLRVRTSVHRKIYNFLHHLSAPRRFLIKGHPWHAPDQQVCGTWLLKLFVILLTTGAPNFVLWIADAPLPLVEESGDGEPCGFNSCTEAFCMLGLFLDTILEPSWTCGLAYDIAISAAGRLRRILID